jgi:hypothetical protein
MACITSTKIGMIEPGVRQSALGRPPKCLHMGGFVSFLREIQKFVGLELPVQRRHADSH